jgi:hypothetical protein
MKYLKHGKDGISEPLFDLGDGEYVTLLDAVAYLIEHHSLVEGKTPSPTHKDDEHGKISTIF